MAIAHVQSSGNFSVAAGTTIAKAYVSNVTAGNILAVLVQWSSSSATASVADTQGNTWNAVAGSLATNATSGNRSEWFWTVPASSGANTVTGTISGSVGERDIYIAEYSGVDAVSPVDASVGANANGANPSTTLTTLTANTMMVAGALVPVGTATVGSGWTSRVTQNGNLYEDKAAAATGSQTVAFTDASSSQWIISAMALKESTGGGGGGTTQQTLTLRGVGS